MYKGCANFNFIPVYMNYEIYIQLIYEPSVMEQSFLSLEWIILIEKPILYYTHHFLATAVPQAH